MGKAKIKLDWSNYVRQNSFLLKELEFILKRVDKIDNLEYSYHEHKKSFFNNRYFRDSSINPWDSYGKVAKGLHQNKDEIYDILEEENLIQIVRDELSQIYKIIQDKSNAQSVEEKLTELIYSFNYSRKKIDLIEKLLGLLGNEVELGNVSLGIDERIENEEVEAIAQKFSQVWSSLSASKASIEQELSSDPQKDFEEGEKEKILLDLDCLRDILNFEKYIFKKVSKYYRKAGDRELARVFSSFSKSKIILKEDILNKLSLDDLSKKVLYEVLEEVLTFKIFDEEEVKVEEEVKEGEVQKEEEVETQKKGKLESIREKVKSFEPFWERSIKKSSSGKKEEKNKFDLEEGKDFLKKILNEVLDLLGRECNVDGEILNSIAQNLIIDESGTKFATLFEDIESEEDFNQKYDILSELFVEKEEIVLSQKIKDLNQKLLIKRFALSKEGVSFRDIAKVYAKMLQMQAQATGEEESEKVKEAKEVFDEFCKSFDLEVLADDNMDYYFNIFNKVGAIILDLLKREYGINKEEAEKLIVDDDSQLSLGYLLFNINDITFVNRAFILFNVFVDDLNNMDERYIIFDKIKSLNSKFFSNLNSAQEQNTEKESSVPQKDKKKRKSRFEKIKSKINVVGRFRKNKEDKEESQIISESYTELSQKFKELFETYGLIAESKDIVINYKEQKGLLKNFSQSDDICAEMLEVSDLKELLDKSSLGFKFIEYSQRLRDNMSILNDFNFDLSKKISVNKENESYFERRLLILDLFEYLIKLGWTEENIKNLNIGKKIITQIYMGNEKLIDEIREFFKFIKSQDKDNISKNYVLGKFNLILEKINEKKLSDSEILLTKGLNLDYYNQNPINLLKKDAFENLLNFANETGLDSLAKIQKKKIQKKIEKLNVIISEYYSYYDDLCEYLTNNYYSSIKPGVKLELLELSFNYLKNPEYEDFNFLNSMRLNGGFVFEDFFKVLKFLKENLGETPNYKLYDFIKFNNLVRIIEKKELSFVNDKISPDILKSANEYLSNLVILINRRNYNIEDFYIDSSNTLVDYVKYMNDSDAQVFLNCFEDLMRIFGEREISLPNNIVFLNNSKSKQDEEIQQEQNTEKESSVPQKDKKKRKKIFGKEKRIKEFLGDLSDKVGDYTESNRQVRLLKKNVNLVVKYFKKQYNIDEKDVKNLIIDSNYKSFSFFFERFEDIKDINNQIEIIKRLFFNDDSQVEVSQEIKDLNKDFFSNLESLEKKSKSKSKFGIDNLKKSFIKKKDTSKKSEKSDEEIQNEEDYKILLNLIGKLEEKIPQRYVYENGGEIEKIDNLKVAYESEEVFCDFKDFKLGLEFFSANNYNFFEKPSDVIPLLNELLWGKGGFENKFLSMNNLKLRYAPEVVSSQKLNTEKLDEEIKDEEDYKILLNLIEKLEEEIPQRYVYENGREIEKIDNLEVAHEKEGLFCDFKDFKHGLEFFSPNNYFFEKPSDVIPLLNELLLEKGDFENKFLSMNNLKLRNVNNQSENSAFVETFHNSKDQSDYDKMMNQIVNNLYKIKEEKDKIEKEFEIDLDNFELKKGWKSIKISEFLEKLNQKDSKLMKSNLIKKMYESLIKDKNNFSFLDFLTEEGKRFLSEKYKLKENINKIEKFLKEKGLSDNQIQDFEIFEDKDEN